MAKEESTDEVINPKAYQTILQHKMMKALQSINKILSAKEMKGILIHQEVEVEGFREIDFLELEPYKAKLFSVDIYNKGDADAYVQVNREGDWIPVEARSYQPLDFDKAHIRYLSMKTTNGSTTLKIVGAY